MDQPSLCIIGVITKQTRHFCETLKGGKLCTFNNKRRYIGPLLIVFPELILFLNDQANNNFDFIFLTNSTNKP